MVDPVHLEVDGHPATAADLAEPALVNYGHFTSLQVRAGRTQGLELHLARLAEATRELFDASLDLAEVRGHIRHALGPSRPDASVRVNVFSTERTGRLSTMVAVRPPGVAPAAVTLHAVTYQRPLAHVKHVGTFGQIHYARLAKRAGFDDALLTTADGVVSETTIANIGFLRAGGVVWPDAPHLGGTGLRLLDAALAATGQPPASGEVRLSGLAGCDAAFVVNSRGVSPVTRIDDHVFADAAPVGRLIALYQAIPWDVI